VEAYASAKSLCRRISELDLLRNEKNLSPSESPNSLISSNVKLSLKSNATTTESSTDMKMDAKEIFSRLAEGDENAIKVVEEVSNYAP